ncbi:LADA_0A07338g1_1 [Lachancea dasiensis]|uniref:ADP-ribose 1''-phosphate phosphatase n=1 Tax=Lachancea dasiensis TaxID=1072105 RepID=A0A1G4IPS1_9SACH|nr:LADA_0A07338g1_1 [Lachancea dasiensis]
MSSSTINYVRGNCLQQTILHPRILIHSCNCNGSWGGGIAYQLAVKYPRAEKDYVELCNRFGNSLLGKFVLIPSYTDANLLIGCLFTASFGGPNQGSERILDFTGRALTDMKTKLTVEEIPDPSELDHFSSQYINAFKSHSRIPLQDYKLELPQINSGIFGVPWPETERLLKKQKSMSFTVYVLD